MILIQTLFPNHLTYHARKQGALSAEVEALAPVFEKSASELRPKRNKNYFDAKAQYT